MSFPRFLAIAGILASLSTCLGLTAMGLAQDAGKPAESSTPNVLGAAASDESLKSINDDYNQQLLLLERQRLERLEHLAARQNAADAAVTYEQLFRLAIAGNMFREAEAAAKTVLSSGRSSLTTMAFAHLVKMIAEADRGAYKQSLETLRQTVAEREKAAERGAPRAELPTDEIVGICDAYYQRLIQNAQFDTARQALQLVLGHTQRPVLKEFLSRRLRRLEHVGKPAPAIQGTDFDGRSYNLADARGKVVLVVFWASWCLPCAAEIESLQDVEQSYRGRGLQVVGINLDTIQDEGQKLETARPNVRRFLLDHNVRWPTLINGQGEKDYAKACDITEIPANLLIARDGKVAAIDLVRKNLEPMIAKALGE